MLIFDQLKKNDAQLRALAWIVAAGMAILFTGLWYVQVIASRRYMQNERNQSYRTVRVPALRGKILDREGEPLAENRPSYNISLYLEDLGLRELFQQEFREARRARIAELRRHSLDGKGRKLTRSEQAELSRASRYRVVSNAVQQISITLQQPVSLDEPDFRAHYEQRLALPLPIVTGLAPVQIARFQENSYNPPGFDMEMQPLRSYPQKTTAAHLLGYLRKDESSEEDEYAFFNFRLPDFKGIAGIEATFNQYLKGKAGVKSVLVNNLGYRQGENELAPVKAGHNVVLTIDLGLQQQVEKALRSANTAGLPVRGAAVVMDVTNGDILAMASVPAFNPNSFVPRISRDEWEKLQDPKQLPMINRATAGAYPPGSTFKIITALTCIEAGVLTEDEVIYNPGYYMVGRRTIDDLARPGEYNFRRAFVRSSNTYFIHFGLKAGLEKLLEMGHRFFLNERTGIPTHQEVSGYFPEYQEVVGAWSAGNTANACIGQEITVTPLQMAVITSAVANGGKVFWPRLVDRIVSQDSALEEPIEVFPGGRLRGEIGVRPRNLDILRKAMLADVEDQQEGSGKEAYLPGMDICGKTGTAQLMRGRTVVDHITWFVSFAPFQSARYAVVVMVESGISGGTTCAPVAREIYRALQRQKPVEKPAALTLAR